MSLTKFNLNFLDSSINIYLIYIFIIFRDQNDPIKQIRRPKRIICKFRDQNNMTEQDINK